MLHTHSHNYKHAPNLIDTNTYIVAWMQSQNLKPIQPGPGSTLSKIPDKKQI